MRSGITLLLIAAFSLFSFQQQDSTKIQKIRPKQAAFEKRIDKALNSIDNALNSIEETALGMNNLTTLNKELFQRAKVLRVINDSLINDRSAQTLAFTKLLAKTYDLSVKSERMRIEDRKKSIEQTKAFSEYMKISIAFMDFFSNASFWIFIPSCAVGFVAIMLIIFYKMEIWRIKNLIKGNV